MANRLALKDAIEQGSKSDNVEDNTVAKSATKGASKGASKAATAPATNGGFALMDGIAIPDTTRPARESKYPWDAMSVGQSFFVPGAKQSTFTTLCSSRNKKAGVKNKFVSKAYTHEGAEGVMVWRKA